MENVKSNLAQIRAQRLEKVAKLKEMGFAAYPSAAINHESVSKITANYQDYENKSVIIVGRLMSWREHGVLIFGHIQDQNGKIQLYIREDTIQQTDQQEQYLGFTDLTLLDIGDFIEAEGMVTKTQSGEISILVKKLKLLSKSLRPLPDKWKSLTDKQTRYRRRYLDLTMNSKVKELFERKARFWEACRNFMHEQGFMEVETPVLEYKTGGADARPFVTHHNDLDIDLYLRISTELYQKRLIGGGYEKIFTLGPNFRNEGVDDEHLQEYTQLEWYWAYADYSNNMELTRNLFRYTASKVYGTTKFSARGHEFDLADDWQEIDYTSIIKEKLGIDIFTSSEQEMLAKIKECGISLPGSINRNRLIDNLWKLIRKDINGPAFLVNEPKFMSPLAKSLKDNPELTERFHIIIAGSELGNGYSEINDPLDQLGRFKEQEAARLSGDEESQMLDIDFVEMLEYGMPPTSGFGMSERVFWFLEDVSGREGSLFPLMREELDNTTKEIYGSDLTVNTNLIKVQDKTKRMVLILSDELSGWQLTNTVAHLTAYLGSKIGKGLLSRPTFTTKDSKEIPANSQYPVISMSASPVQLQNLLIKIKEAGLPYLAYTQDMITFSDDEQLAEALKGQELSQLKIIGLGVFGENEKIKSLTNKFSLWK